MVFVQAPNAAPGLSSSVPMRSLRRATARRASRRRAFARSRKTDSDLRIIDFVFHHPGSTIGDLSRSLDLDPDHVAARLAQLTSAGTIHRPAHGYGARQPA